MYIIKQVPQKDIEKAKELFCICFDADKTEAELFFAPKEKTVIGAYSNERLCSMLTVFKCKARNIPAAYMAGVATAPDCRGNKLFSKCFDYFLSNYSGFDFIFCIPASQSLFRLYESVGLSEKLYLKKAVVQFDNTVTQNNCNIKILRYGDDLSIYHIKTKEIYRNKGRLLIEKSDELADSTLNTYLYFGGMAAIGDNFTALFHKENGQTIIADLAVNGEKADVEQVISMLSQGKKSVVTIPDVDCTVFENEKRIPIAASKIINSSVSLEGLHVNVLYNDM